MPTPAPLLSVPALAGVPDPAAPWWRFGIVWFALSGPAVVIVAGFATMAIAFSGADEPIPEQPIARATAVTAQATATPQAPALQARNHAATPSR